MRLLLLSIFFFFFFFFLLLSLLSTESSAAKFAGFPSSLVRSELEARKSTSNKVVGYETKYFMQTLDHFNYRPEGYAEFRQRYLVDDRHWAGPDQAGPIFVYCGNEGDIEWFANNTGFMFDVAPYFKALLLFIEHRYYGDSIPFGGNKSVAFANATTLGYLSTTQALADYATLITDLKKNLSSEQSPVVVLGGSYGGMLAAWFRLKYPHVAIGALASSAPILNFLDLASPYTFNNIITNDFKSESENCYKVLKNSWDEIDKAGTHEDGIKKLAESFKVCNGGSLGGSSLADYIEAWIEEALIYVAMTDYPTPSDFIEPLPAYPIKRVLSLTGYSDMHAYMYLSFLPLSNLCNKCRLKINLQMCSAIDNPTAGTDTFARLRGAMNVYYNHSGAAGDCFDLTQRGGNAALGHSGWAWQSCTEMIIPTGGNNNESIFPASTYNYTEVAEVCQYVYGVAPRPHWTTTEFGGHDIRRVLKRFGSNIIFFNGLRDPWSGGGVLESLSRSLVAIVAPQGAHHVDLRFSTKDDPLWLRAVRRRELQIIRGWLRQYYKNSA